MSKSKKKYAFTGETKVYIGRTLRRIQRISDGLVGGWIELESNLSHRGECFVYDEAMVYDGAIVANNARVLNNAIVGGYATITGDAVVKDLAHVYGSARVTGYAMVEGMSSVYDNARISAGAVVYGKAVVCGHGEVEGEAEVSGNAVIRGIGSVGGDARVGGTAVVVQDVIIGRVDTPFEYIFQSLCNRGVLTAVKTRSNEILLNVGNLYNMTEDDFIRRINDSGCCKGEYLLHLEFAKAYFKACENNFESPKSYNLSDINFLEDMED